MNTICFPFSYTRLFRMYVCVYLCTLIPYSSQNAPSLIKCLFPPLMPFPSLTASLSKELPEASLMWVWSKIRLLPSKIWDLKVLPCSLLRIWQRTSKWDYKYSCSLFDFKTLGCQSLRSEECLAFNMYFSTLLSKIPIQTLTKKC